jgi:hypothetical protein
MEKDKISDEFTKVIGHFPNETSTLVMVFSILDEERRSG